MMVCAPAARMMLRAIYLGECSEKYGFRGSMSGFGQISGVVTNQRQIQFGLKFIF
jgi:hypothetical protein